MNIYILIEEVARNSANNATESGASSIVQMAKKLYHSK
jgi:hypothetical protein